MWSATSPTASSAASEKQMPLHGAPWHTQNQATHSCTRGVGAFFSGADQLQERWPCLCRRLSSAFVGGPWPPISLACWPQLVHPAWQAYVATTLWLLCGQHCCPPPSKDTLLHDAHAL